MTRPHYSYYNTGGTSGNSSWQHEQKHSSKGHEKKKKEKSLASRIGVVALCAVIAGVVGGGAFFGVNYAANKVYSSLETQTADADTETEDLQAEVSEVSEEVDGTSDDSLSSTTDSVTTEMTVAEVAAACLPSTVTIAAVSQEELQSIFGGSQTYEVSSAGTGVIIGENDTELLIATNNHVVDGATSLSVGFIDESTVEAQIKGQDSDNDLAVLAVKLEDISDETLSEIKIATIGDSDAMQLGEQVVAIGNALGYGQSVTSGYLSAKDRSITVSDGNNTYELTGLLQIDAAINPGNSGGPLFNMEGELIGINESKVTSTSSNVVVEGIGYAIPISEAEPILEELMTLETREVVDEADRGYLGITCVDVTSDVSAMYNMPEGVCITEVLEGSAAEEAGMMRGDVIIEIDGRSVSGYDELTNELSYYAAGDTVDFVVMRAHNGTYEEITITVTLGDASALNNYYASNE